MSTEKTLHKVPTPAAPAYYKIRVRRRGGWFWKSHDVVGHRLTDATVVEDPSQKAGYRVTSSGPMRLELEHAFGRGMTVFVDASTLELELGDDWHQFASAIERRRLEAATQS